ncbi:MAG: serine/threonine-protein phosphatase [Anaerolineae bacterium]|nr:serine/threonine-protein phosphatase [Anaerolineae bacterium]
MRLFQKLFGKRGSSSLLPSPTEEGNESKGHTLVVGALTDKGCVRERNEDALFTLSTVFSQDEEMLPMSLYIVADGMGGYEGGQQASALTVRLVANWILSKLYLPYLLDEGHSADRRPINQVLTEGTVIANGKVFEACPGAGTTLTCAFVLGTNAFLAHVGDSRAYLVSRNTIRQITTDHSLVNRLVELGQITPEEAKIHPQRNILYRALGRAGNLEVDTHLQSLPLNSSLLLCSDGLWGMIPEAEMLKIINAAPSPQVACNRLVAQAKENGGEDNITAILVQVRG